MPRNQKLTALIKGRSVRSASGEPGKLVIVFDDHSTMTVKTAGLATSISTGGKIKPFWTTVTNAPCSLRMVRRPHCELPIRAHRSRCSIGAMR